MEYSQSSAANVQPAPVNTPSRTTPFVPFAYVGKTALTVIGNVTGRQYRFNHPGARQAIDYRDVPGIKGIPVLKKTT